MGIATSYRLRWRRKRRRFRAWRKRDELSVVADRTGKIGPDQVLAFTVLRNEMVRLPYFLSYYRDLGVSHFLMVDNGSTDGSGAYLAEQHDVSVWRTEASYRRARFGMDWMNWLLSRYGHGHWCLTVDADEFLVYPFCDTRTLPALTEWLQSAQIRSFSAMLLDMYPKGPIGEEVYQPGQDPFEIASWFDSGNYTITRHHLLRNLFIQGGPRARAFFADDPDKSPALNKIPLVRWDRRFVYASSTHALLPRGLNIVYDEAGGEKASGCLLHAKFLNTFPERVSEEVERGEHFAGSREYLAYHKKAAQQPALWTRWSEKYVNWRQLEALGLISKGDWI